MERVLNSDMAYVSYVDVVELSNSLSNIRKSYLRDSRSFLQCDDHQSHTDDQAPLAPFSPDRDHTLHNSGTVILLIVELGMVGSLPFGIGFDSGIATYV